MLSLVQRLLSVAIMLNTMKWVGSGGDDYDLSGLLPEHDSERTKKDH
jgi:hypothetical protein